MISQWEVQPNDDVDRRQRVAVVELSAEALLSLLVAPEGMTIANVSWTGRSIRLIVSHPALRVVEEGSEGPNLYPRYSTEHQTTNADWGLGE